MSEMTNGTEQNATATPGDAATASRDAVTGSAGATYAAAGAGSAAAGRGFSPTAATAAAAQRRELISRADFAAALTEVTALATRTLRMFDPTVAAFGFNTPQREQQLSAFLRASRMNRLMIVVHEPHIITQSSPRLLRLLRQFSHAIAIHQTHDTIRNIDDVLVIADELHSIRKPHHDQVRGVVTLHEPVETREWVSRFNAIWEQSTPSVSATTIGL